jgi:MGT family glycosyltransferase
MSNFLFALPDGAGVVPPILSVAGALVRAGHDVRALADPVLEPEVRAVGVRYVPWTRAPHRFVRGEATEFLRDWEARTPAGSFACLRDEIMVGPAGRFADDVLEELARERPDVVVAEAVLLGAQLAAEAAGVPLAVLHTTVMPFPAPGHPPLGPGFQPAKGRTGRVRDAVVARLGARLWDKGLPALNAVRAEHGLAPLRAALDQLLQADRVLVLTTAAFDFSPRGLPPNLRYTGPRIDDPAWAQPWEPPPGDAPLVLVSLSSGYQGQLPVLRRAVAALDGAGVRGVVTTGPSIDPALLPAAPAGVQVVASAPHRAVFGQAAAIVSHCGHGTVMKALAHGVPVVCLPMGRDQLDVAARVEAAGAGVRLRPGSSPRALRTAIRRVVGDPAYGRAARRMADLIAADLAEDRARAELEALAAGSRAPAVA